MGATGPNTTTTVFREFHTPAMVTSGLLGTGYRCAGASLAERSTPRFRNIDAAQQMSIGVLRHSDVPRFVDLVREQVSFRYPGTEPLYALNVAGEAYGGTDFHGLSTVRRTVWCLFVRGVACGFCAASQKFGGVVKLGPIVIEESIRRRGFGAQLITAVADNYAVAGFSKLYMTVSAVNSAGCAFASEAGFFLEARLRQQYSLDHDELVFGRVLSHPLTSRTQSAPLRTQQTQPACDRARSETAAGDRTALMSAPSRQPRDLSSTIRLENASVKTFYRHKGAEVAGAMVAAPKRGGSVRLHPLYGEPTHIADLVTDSEWYYRSIGARRLYGIVSVADSRTISTLVALGYEVEGTLLAPCGPSKARLVLGRSWSD